MSVNHTGPEGRYPEGAWAPVVIETLVHIAVFPKPLHQSNSTQWAVNTLEHAGMIERSGRDEAGGWELTGRGYAHLRAMCQLPYPCSDTVVGEAEWHIEFGAGIVRIPILP